jgi:uncharacterized protein (DUF1330 family)
MIEAFLLILQAMTADAAPPPPQSTCDQPVFMVVSGPTHDRERMMAYGKAIADSELYQKLGGYYINVPRAAEVFEGDVAPNFTTLIVRFPCIENARAFWYSRVYQDEIRPLRLNPSAGDYLVQVFKEAPVRSDMVGKVGDNSYRAEFVADGIAQKDSQ